MESQKEIPQGRTKTDEEIEKFVLLAVILVPILFFLIPALVGMVLFVALYALKQQRFAPYIGIAGVGILIFEGSRGQILSYLGVFKLYPIDFVTKAIEKLLQKPLEMDFHAYLSLVALSMVFCLAVGIYAKFKWKSPVISKQEQIAKLKKSRPYQKFMENRFKFLEKKQLQYRKSHSREVFLGYSDTKERIEVPEKEFNYHMLAVGGTGTGKSTLIGAIMEGALRKGKPIIFVDGKGERKSMLEFKELCEAYGKKVYMFSEHDDFTYNPIKNGNATEIRDRLMDLFDWSENYYEDIASLFLQRIVQLIDAAGIERDLHTVYRLLDLQEIENIFDSCEVEMTRMVPQKKTVKKAQKVLQSAVSNDPFAEYEEMPEEPQGAEEEEIELVPEQYFDLPPELKDLRKKFEDYLQDKDFIKNLSGLRSQLGELLESELGHKFRNSEKEIDLRRITDEGNIVIFTISGNRYQEYIKKLGQIIILDINSLIAYRQDTGRKATLAIFDEFSAYGNQRAVDIVNKGRSAGIEGIISTQSLADIDKVDPFLTSQLITNCNIFAIGRVNDPDDAERLSKAFSTFSDSEITSQIEKKNNLLKLTSEMGTVKKVEAFIVHPKEIKALDIGQVFIARKLKQEKSGGNYTRLVYVRNSINTKGARKMVITKGWRAMLIAMSLSWNVQHYLDKKTRKRANSNSAYEEKKDIRRLQDGDEARDAHSKAEGREDKGTEARKED